MLSAALGASRSVARTPVDPLDEFAGECDAFLEVFGVEVLNEGVAIEGLGAGEWDARKSSCCSSLELARSSRVVVMASVADRETFCLWSMLPSCKDEPWRSTVPVSSPVPFDHLMPAPITMPGGRDRCIERRRNAGATSVSPANRITPMVRFPSVATV